MTDRNPHPVEDDDEVAASLAAQPPRPSSALRRRVRGRMQLALTRSALRRRAIGLAAVGSAGLLVALVLAVSVPR